MDSVQEGIDGSPVTFSLSAIKPICQFTIASKDGRSNIYQYVDRIIRANITAPRQMSQLLLNRPAGRRQVPDPTACLNVAAKDVTARIN
jgi:hypothetical protein